MPSAWSIKWDTRALKDVAELPKDERQRIVDAIEQLSAHPLKGKPLKGRWKGLRRVRVVCTGSYILCAGLSLRCECCA